MLSIPATGLLNASPATKTQQSQYKYDSMPALKRVSNDTTSFKWNVQKEIRRKILEQYDDEAFISSVETTFFKNIKAKLDALYAARDVLTNKTGYSGNLHAIQNAINRLEAQKSKKS